MTILYLKYNYQVMLVHYTAYNDIILIVKACHIKYSRLSTDMRLVGLELKIQMSKLHVKLFDVITLKCYLSISTGRTVNARSKCHFTSALIESHQVLYRITEPFQKAIFFKQLSVH